MRILHFSDIHIGIESYGRPLTEADLPSLPAWFAPGEDRRAYLGQSTRLVDFLCAFDELAAYAIEQGADLVLFAGDAYKNREPTQTHQREFAKRVARLAKAGVPIFLLAGNHDLPHTAHKATAIEIFDTLRVPGVTIAESIGVYKIETRSGPLQVLALPWVRRSGFLARDEVRNLPYQQVRELMERKVTELLEAEAAALDPSLPAVVAAHVTLNTARLGTERTMMIGDDHVLLQSSLARLPVDYVALGHIHRRQELHQQPPIVYPGSLQRVDFGEEDHEEKGFYVIELDSARPQGQRLLSLAFRPVQARAFVTVEAAIEASDPDPTATVVRAILRSGETRGALHVLPERKPVKDAIVRVQVKLPASAAAAFRERDVRKALDEAGAHHVAGVFREVERTQRVRLGAFTGERKSPEDLLRFYFETKSVPSARAERLVEYARRLMQSQGESGV